MHRVLTQQRSPRTPAAQRAELVALDPIVDHHDPRPPEASRARRQSRLLGAAPRRARHRTAAMEPRWTPRPPGPRRSRTARAAPARRAQPRRRPRGPIMPRSVPWRRRCRVSALRVDAVQAWDVEHPQLLVERAVAPGMAHVGRQLADHERARQCTRKDSARVVPAAVVADESIGHHHDLAGVRRIGDDLLVSRHAGVEHHLAAARLQRLAPKRTPPNIAPDSSASTTAAFRHAPPPLPRGSASASGAPDAAHDREQHAPAQRDPESGVLRDARAQCAGDTVHAALGSNSMQLGRARRRAGAAPDARRRAARGTGRR